MYTVKTRELKQLRKEKGISQAALAELLNKEQTTYSKIERGKSGISLEIAHKIAIILESNIQSFINIPVKDNDLKKSSINSIFVGKKKLDKLITLFEEIVSLLKEKINS